MIKWLTALISLLLILVILVFGPVGLKIVGAIAKDKIPGQLQYQSISGNLFGPITLTGIEYQYRDVNIKAQTLHLSWKSIFPLHITDLSSNNVIITKSKPQPLNLKDWIQAREKTLKKRKDHTKKEETDKKARTPLELTIDHAQINNITLIANQGKNSSHIKEILLSANINQHQHQASLQIDTDQPTQYTIKANMQGKPNDYTINLKAYDNHNAFSIKGHGNKQTLDLTTEKNSLWNGNLTGNIQLNWEKPLSWIINLKAEHLQPDHWLPIKNMTLNFNLKAQGNRETGAINLSHISAIIEQQPITGQMQLLYNGNQINQLQLNLHNTYGNVNINGDYGDQLNLNWNMVIKNLQKITPNMPKDIAGNIITTGSIQGEKLHPIISGNLKTTNLHILGYSIKKSQADFNINLKDQILSSLNMNVTKLQAPNFFLKKITANLFGDEKKHTLELEIDGRKTSTNITLNGRLKDDIWHASLENFTNSSKKFGTWQLEKSANILLSNDKISIENPVCLQNNKKNSKACLNGQWKKKASWEGVFDGNNIPLALYKKFKKSDFTLAGDAKSIHIKIKGKRKQLEHANILIKTTPGNFHYSKKDGTPIEIDFNSIDYQATFSKGSGLKSTGDIEFSDKNHLNFSLNLPNYTGIGLPQAKNRVRGSIKTNTSEMTWLTALVTKSSNATGKININFNLQGTIGKPLLYGKAVLTNGGIKLDGLGITISRGNITAIAKGNQLIYNGSVYSGATTYVTGNTYLDQPHLPTTINVNGNNILIWNTDEYTVYANAKIIIQTKEDGTHITGTVLVPKAYIHPTNFIGVATLPNEIIFVKNGKPIKTDQSHMHSNIKITAGKDVKLNTIGIRGLVNGSITIIDTPKQVTYANGQLSLSNGTYSTFGKTLAITRGNLNFNKSPLTNPNLNVLAIKKSSNTATSSAQGLQTNSLIVGVELTGQLKRPKITLYSNNTQLSQADILSYIVLGSQSSEASPSSLSLLVQALGSLQKNQGDQNQQSSLARLTQILDFNEFGTESSSVTDASGTQLQAQKNFVIGRYIGSRVYLRYVKDTTNAQAKDKTFEARYYLKPGWFIQLSRTTNGNSNTISNGLDLLYTTSRK